MLDLGTIFSICAGILIGLKLYYKFFSSVPKRRINCSELDSQKRMQEIIDQQKYGVVYVKNDERIIELGNGKFLLVKDIPAQRSFWHDLWYGSGG